MIAETLRGIMEQGESLERVLSVVIADDASPDRTLEIVRKTWSRDSPPLTFRAVTKNLGEMINVNMTVASLPPDAEWFLHMHGDNIPKSDWLKTLTDRCLAAAPNVGIVCASYDSFHEDGRIEPGEDLDVGPSLIEGTLESIRGTIRRGCWWHNSCGAVRVTTFQEVGGFPPGMRQKGDWDFLLRVLKSGWDIEYLPRTLMRYRIHEDSASGFAFRAHLDIEESLQVIQKYARDLTFWDIVSVHGRNAQFLCRRAARSLTRRDWRRLAGALRMLARTGGSFVSCLATP